MGGGKIWTVDTLVGRSRYCFYFANSIYFCNIKWIFWSIRFYGEFRRN